MYKAQQLTSFSLFLNFAFVIGQKGAGNDNNLKENLSKYCNQGIDVNFENVGGEVFWDIFDHMNF